MLTILTQRFGTIIVPTLQIVNAAQEKSLLLGLQLLLIDGIIDENYRYDAIKEKSAQGFTKYKNYGTITSILLLCPKKLGGKVSYEVPVLFSFRK